VEKQRSPSIEDHDLTEGTRNGRVGLWPVRATVRRCQPFLGCLSRGCASLWSFGVLGLQREFERSRAFSFAAGSSRVCAHERLRAQTLSDIPTLLKILPQPLGLFPLARMGQFPLAARRVPKQSQAAPEPQPISGQMPGQSIASPQLQMDTWNQNIIPVDLAFAPQCQDRKVVNTELIEKPTGVRIEGDRFLAGKWVERWTVNRCGTLVRYTVEYIADGKGGTFIGLDAPPD